MEGGAVSTAAMDSGRLTALAARLADLEARRDQILAEIDSLRAMLVVALDVVEVVEIEGKPLYTLRPGRRTFQQDKAVVLLAGSPLLGKVSVTKVDGAALKRASEAIWEACCSVGEPYLQAVR